MIIEAVTVPCRIEAARRKISFHWIRTSFRLSLPPIGGACVDLPALPPRAAYLERRPLIGWVVVWGLYASAAIIADNASVALPEGFPPRLDLLLPPFALGCEPRAECIHWQIEQRPLVARNGGRIFAARINE